MSTERIGQVEHVIEENAKRPHVNPEAMLLFEVDFRSFIEVGSNVGSPHLVLRFAEAKVCEFECFLAIMIADKDVFELEITVEVTLVVQVDHALDDVSEHVYCFCQGEDFTLEGTLVGEQVSAVAVLQQHVEVLVVFEIIVDFDDVGRVHVLHNVDLFLQVGSDFGFFGNGVLADEFEGVLFALAVLDQVDVPVGASA